MLNRILPTEYSPNFPYHCEKCNSWGTPTHIKYCESKARYYDTEADKYISLSPEEDTKLRNNINLEARQREIEQENT